MPCAVVDADGNVVNMIVADPTKDLPPEGCTLVDMAGKPVETDWVHVDGELTPPKVFAVLDEENKVEEFVTVKANEAPPEGALDVTEEKHIDVGSAWDPFTGFEEVAARP